MFLPDQERWPPRYDESFVLGLTLCHTHEGHATSVYRYVSVWEAPARFLGLDRNVDCSFCAVNFIIVNAFVDTTAEPELYFNSWLCNKSLMRNIQLLLFIIQIVRFYGHFIVLVITTIK